MEINVLAVHTQGNWDSPHCVLTDCDPNWIIFKPHIESRKTQSYFYIVIFYSHSIGNTENTVPDFLCIYRLLEKLFRRELAKVLKLECGCKIWTADLLGICGSPLYLTCSEFVEILGAFITDYRSVAQMFIQTDPTNCQPVSSVLYSPSCEHRHFWNIVRRIYSKTGIPSSWL